MSDTNVTTDHDEIRRWVEERDGRPARVKETGSDGDPGILRIDFRDPDESLEEIPWDEFFRAFDENNLAFLHQDRTEDGSVSRFNKFVDRSGRSLAPTSLQRSGVDTGAPGRGRTEYADTICWPCPFILVST